MTESRRSSAAWLWLGYVVLVAYASLYPFGPWEWPGGWQATDVLRLPWPRYWGQIDLWANALGYVPLGFLGVAALWRRGHRAGTALALGGSLPVALAYAMEVVQHFLPSRVPSLADWALNSAGALMGMAWAGAAIASGQLKRVAQWRERWFAPHTAGALALLACWPLGLAFPAPAPLAQGQFLPSVYEWARTLAEERAWALLPEWPQLRALALPEFLATLLGLLAPCGLMLASARRGWHRALMVMGAAAVGVGMSSLSAALGFGPTKAWAWATAQTGPALVTGVVLALALTWLPARWNAVLAVLWLTLLLAVVNLMGGDPYLEASLSAWTGSPQIRLYGLLQWVGRLWPVLALGWLVASLARRET